MTSRHLRTVESMMAADPVLQICDDATLSDLLAEIALLVNSSRELMYLGLDNEDFESSELEWLPYHLLGQAMALIKAAKDQAEQQPITGKLTLFSQ